MNWLSRSRAITDPAVFSVPLGVKTAIMCFEQNFFSALMQSLCPDGAIPAPLIAGAHEGLICEDLVIYRCYFGAPAAGLHLESLIASGVKRVLVAGEAGSISLELKIGDIYLPTWGMREEGTSYHYLPPEVVCKPSEGLLDDIRCRLEKRNTGEGGVWTIDAGLRETEDKVRGYSNLGIHAVDMECTALMSIAMYRGVDLACILVITDELSTGNWIRRFNDPCVNESKASVAEAFREMILK